MTLNNVKIEIYIPKSHFEELRLILIEAKAGNHGNYDSCLSVTEVEGYWRPLEGANPYNGKVGKLCHSKELKVEVTCKKEYLDNTLKRIKEIHPYEVPVINVIPLIH